jgi:hypothetical protein
VLALLLLSGTAQAQGDDWFACRQAMAMVEPGSGLPPGMLLAIGLVESGRADPRGGLQPWPWAINNAGESRLVASKAEAVRQVAALLAGGARSVDVGCMQINLQSHPNAFANLEQAFDPLANVRYAADLLRRLYARSQDWAQAIADYHSGDAERGLAYHSRVVLARLGAAFTRGGAVPLPARATAGLCAPGRSAALVWPRRPAARRPHLVCQIASRRQP